MTNETPLAELRSLEWQEKLAIGKLKAANRLPDAERRRQARSTAMRDLNLIRTKKRHAYLRAQGKRPPRRETPDFTDTCCGIPCGVHVTSFTPGWGGSSFEPPEPPEVEFELLDSNGYRAAWLEEKLEDNQDEEDRLRGECMRHHYEQRQAAAEARAEARYEAMKLGED